MFISSVYLNANFVILRKAQITRKWIKLYRPFNMHCARTRVGDTLLQFKWNEDLFRDEKCKVTFGVKYNYISLVL